MRIRVLSALAAAVCVLSAGAQEPKCDSLARLQGSKSGYQSRGNRCEGLYVSKVGSRSLAAMSYTLGKLKFDLASSAPLEVTAPGQTQPINVRAVAIPLKTYYRMDATLAPRATLSWPLKDVLAPEGLTDSRIGIFGWRGAEEGGTLVPLRVSAAGAKPASQTPLLVIRASFDVQQAKWRWAAMRDDRCAAFGAWQDAIQRPATAGWPIAIELSQVPAGTHCFEAVAQSGSSTEWSPLKLKIDVPQP